jgi:Mg-chelatase subunit ChlI
MKRYSFALAAAMLFAGSAVFAQASMNPVVDKFVTDYRAEGYTRFEVRSGLTQVKIEAYRGTEKVEVILDKTTGEVLKSEIEAAGLFDDNTPGVFIRERNRDFLRLESDDDSNDDDEDEDGDDSDDDSSDDDSSDDDSDDNSGGSDDSDDDSNDDNGGDRNGSDDSDDDSNDDNGGDRNGSDDSNDDNSGSGGGSDDDGDDD